MNYKHILFIILSITLYKTSYIQMQKISIPQTIMNNSFISDFYIKGNDSLTLRQRDRYVGWNRNMSNYPSYIVEIENSEAQEFHLFGEIYSLCVIKNDNQSLVYQFQTSIFPKSKTDLTQMGQFTETFIKDEMILMVGTTKQQQTIIVQKNSTTSIIIKYYVSYHQEIKALTFMDGEYYAIILKIQQKVLIKQFHSSALFQCAINVTNIKDDFIKYYSHTYQVHNITYVAEYIMVADTSNTYFIYQRVLKSSQSRVKNFGLYSTFQDNDIIAIDFYNQTHTYQLSSNKVILRALLEPPLLIKSTKNDPHILINGAVSINPIPDDVDAYYGMNIFQIFDIQEMGFFRVFSDIPEIDLDFIKKGFYVKSYFVLANEYALKYNTQLQIVERLWQNHELIDIICSYPRFIATIFKQNNYQLSIFDPSFLNYDLSEDKIIIEYPNIIRIKMESAYDTNGTNIMLIIKFINGTILNQLWNVNSQYKLNKIGSFINKINLDYIATKHLFPDYKKITYFYGIDQWLNSRRLLVYSTNGDLVLNIILPNSFSFYKLYQDYIFLFTLDQLCYIYLVQNYNKGIVTLVQCVYFHEMTLGQINYDNVNIFEDDTIDQYYGKNFIIYFSIFNTTYFYNTIDPLKNITLEKYSINEINIDQLLVKPFTIQEQTSFCYMLQNYTLILIKLNNLKLQYQSYNLSLALAGSKNISIKIKGHNILIKYSLNNMTHLIKYDYNSLTKTPIQNNWSYNQNKIFPKFDINNKGEIVLFANSNIYEQLYQFPQNPQKLSTSLEIKSLSRSGIIMIAGTQSYNSSSYLVYFNLINQEISNYLIEYPYTLCHVLGNWMVFSNSSNFFTLQIFPERYAIVQQKLSYTIRQVKILEQYSILVVTEDSMLIRNNCSITNFQTYIFKNKNTDKLLFDYSNQVIAFSLDHQNISIYFYNGTFISSIKMAQQIQQIRLNQQRQLYILLIDKTILVFSMINCSTNKIENNGICICPKSMTQVNNNCLCSEGTYKDNNDCLQCSFLCSSCTSSGLNCQAYNTAIVVGIAGGIVFIITSVVVLIICIKKYRKNILLEQQKRQKQSLLSDEKFPRNRSDIYDQ